MSNTSENTLGLNLDNVKEEEEEVPKLIPTDEETLKQSISSFLCFHQDSKDESSKKDVEPSTSKDPVKRKRQQNEESSLHFITDVFLRLLYPLSQCMSKCISIGLFKSIEFKPCVMLNHGAKKILFSESAWSCFNKHLHIIECYLMNKVYGKKTSIRLVDSDIEIDNVKLRGSACVRLRNLSKHDDRIQLTFDEFYMLTGVVPAINRYMKQLLLAEQIIKDYLLDTIEKHMPLLYGPIDTCIYNRLPQEVHLYRQMTDFLKNAVISSSFLKEGNEDINQSTTMQPEEKIDLTSSEEVKTN